MIFALRNYRRADSRGPTTICGVLEATFVAHVVRPFHSRKATEIIAAPKVYGFDTGFVCAHRGWMELRPEDLGPLWEHFVLNELQAHTQSREIRYWRDKRGHEVDFVSVRQGRPPLAIECKWSTREFDPKNFRAFTHQYPRSECIVVTSDAVPSFTRKYGELSVKFLSLLELVKRIDMR